MVKFLDTKADFDEALGSAGDKVVVVDFTAKWCGPCQMIGPKFAEMAVEFTNALFYKVDVDDNDETAEFAGIKAMPTFIFYKDGKKIDSLSGANEAKLREMIQKYV